MVKLNGVEYNSEYDDSKINDTEKDSGDVNHVNRSGYVPPNHLAITILPSASGTSSGVHQNGHRNRTRLESHGDDFNGMVVHCSGISPTPESNVSDVRRGVNSDDGISQECPTISSSVKLSNNAVTAPTGTGVYAHDTAVQVHNYDLHGATPEPTTTQCERFNVGKTEGDDGTHEQVNISTKGITCDINIHI